MLCRSRSIFRGGFVFGGWFCKTTPRDVSFFGSFMQHLRELHVGGYWMKRSSRGCYVSELFHEIPELFCLRVLSV